MEKTKQISLVRTLIAAVLLLTGSSGGVAWGQVQENPSFDSSGLVGPGWHCSGDYHIKETSWRYPDNNFGPGESGTISPIMGINTPYWGVWSNGTSINRTPFSSPDGIITVGHTENVVGINANHPRVGSSCTVTWTSSDHVGHSASGSAYIHAPAYAPTVPDRTGVYGNNNNMPTYADTTHITVTTVGHDIVKSDKPWQLQVFNFLDNPWYYFKYVLEENAGHCPVGPFEHWKHVGGIWTNVGPQSCNYPGVRYTGSKEMGGYVPGKITLVAGSHVQLDGGSASYSIGAGGHANSKAFLKLPNSWYTLMNDKDFDAKSIVDVGAGGDITWGGAGGSLGPNAVLGIYGNYIHGSTKIKTNASGGTILFGPNHSTTSGQDEIDITPASGDAGNAFGLKTGGSAGNEVYTHVCIPADGTANFGNYKGNDLWIDELKIQGGANATIGSGALQIFNTMANLKMDKAYTISQTGAGNLIMVAHDTLTINKKQTLSSTNTSTANTNLMGGAVVLNAEESFIGEGTGSFPNQSTYSVVAFGNLLTTPTKAPQTPLSSFNLCTPSFDWCSGSEKTDLIGVVAPTDQQAAPPAYTAYKPSVTFTGCLSNFSGDGNISYAAGANSAVTLSNSHSARWHAANDISVNDKHFTWTNSGSGKMQWIAGGGINVAANAQADWTLSGQNSEAIWQAGTSILLNGSNHMNWTASLQNTKMGWQARDTIKSLNGLTADWTSSAAGADMWWEAGFNIAMLNSASLNWETTNSGNLRWVAGQDIRVIDPTALKWKNSGSSTGGSNILWEAGHDIIAENTTAATAFSFEQTTSKGGSTRWQAGNDIRAKGNKEFKNSTTGPGIGTGGTMIWRAKRNIETTTATAPNTVTFSKTTPSAGLTAWQAGNDINTDTKIKFENTAQANNTNMEWLACGNITTHFVNPNFDNSTPNYDVEFLNDSQGDMIWHANTGNITTNSTTTFKNMNTTGSDMGWYAGHDILTHFGKDNTNQAMGAGILFKQAGKGKTSWLAGRDIKTYNTVYFDWTAAANDSTPITWLATHNIIIGGDEEVSGDKNGYSVTIPAQAAAKFETVKNNQILLKTDLEMIQTNSRVDFLRNNQNTALTKLWAGCQKYTLDNNIDIENEFNYVETNQTDTALVHLYAENDIRSNWVCDNNRPAPILFNLQGAPNSKTRTLWEAERNINTKGRVDFIYTGVQDAGPLTWLSRGGYIQTERPVMINKYTSTKPISFLAEDWRHDATNAPGSNFIGRRGNIHFYDSVDIKRNNQNGGLTQIKAENHIWTAMLNYVDEQSTGDTMDIISHKGDIYLGYNDGMSLSQTFNDRRYVALINNGSIYQASPTGRPGGTDCQYPKANDVSYDLNRFTYNIPASNTKGHLWIKAGWEEKTDRNAVPDYTGPANADSSRAAGGNIYFTHIDVMQATGSNHPTVISIPFSGLWRCDNKTTGDSVLHRRAGSSFQRYENSGIISGVNRCFVPYPGNDVHNTVAHDTGLVYRGAKGDLTVDAGNRGNIIFNKGAYVSFQDPSSTGNSIFRTRYGDIDMRDPFNVDTIHGSMLFLAQRDNLSDLSKTGICGCDEERNNVYLQDFQYKAHEASGSIFVGADNNIKLNYGGLQNMGTRHDPFLSKDYKQCKEGYSAKWGEGYLNGGGCGKAYHCDAVEPENQARPLVLNFEQDRGGKAITKGGFAAVASDYIDVYKKMVYRGGRGSGMGSVPGTGTLHGETVNGYGLFMKTQANKNNWTINIFHEIPKCPTTCAGENCDRDYLHLVSRLTFHDDADIQAQNQKVMLWSPVIETYGKMTLDTKKNSGNNTEITLKADSLIFHDDFVKIGNKTKLSTWSGLKDDKPVMKFGHMRHKPPFVELKYDDCSDTIHCAPCHYYIRGSKDPLHMMDTITIKFGDDAYLERLNTVVFDHTVLTCLTDSFDHIKGAPVLNAMIRTDTMKVRNQVDLFADKNHERDAHLELISERQMGSKDYAGIYTKHLHMEPIGACGTPYSELWTSDDLALDVITTSIFGGFGFIHSDVHVENGAHLNAGFTSLRLRGLCYEQLCGTQRMKDLRLDVGAQLHFSVGTTKGLNGEYSDAIEVEKLTTYGSVDVNIEIRPCEKMEKRCYPIIYYKSLTPNSLNNLKVKPATVKIDGQDYPLHLNIGTDGIVYVCVGDAQPVDLTRTVTIPSVTGVTTDPVPGIWEVKSRGNFKFKATFSGTKPLAVRTSRMVNGAPEMLTGKKNANGEYEYVIPHVQEDITLTIGPDFVANELLAGTAVWSHGEMIYIRVDRADIASIYSVAGQLVRKIDLPEGDTSIPMSRGAYVITLKDGSVHKVIVK